MDYKKTNAPHNTITRDMNQLSEEVGNIYETVAILGKRANQIGIALKKELDAKLQDFSIPQEGIDEVFENKEQIEISMVSFHQIYLLFYWRNTQYSPRHFMSTIKFNTHDNPVRIWLINRHGVCNKVADTTVEFFF